MREAVDWLRVPSVGGRAAAGHGELGVASVPESAADREGLVAADAALYRAKRGGNNRVERAERVAATG